MKLINNIGIGFGVLLILTGLFYLIAGLTDKRAEVAIPVVISGVIIVFMNVLFFDNGNMFKEFKRKRSM